jgi:hypothetical protein
MSEELTNLLQVVVPAVAPLYLRLAAEVFSSIRTGGGLRRILLSVWFGEQVPAPIAADYKKELSTDVK